MQRSVLIIDDEVDQCLLIRVYLQKKGFRVDCAHTLADGIEKLRLNATDYLLLDNHLPDGFGWKYATLIKSLFPGVQITLLTGGDAENLRVGADFQQLIKPWHFNQLEACLRAA